MNIAEAACAAGQCAASSSACVASAPGALCAECSYRGWLNGGVCVCARAHYDPSAACAPVVSYASSLALSVRTSRATCTAFASQTTGFFHQPDENAHTYGDSNPPIVTQCASALWGPQPGGAVDALLPGTTPFTCNTYVARDPNAVNDTSAVTCAGHGSWNATTYRCEPCARGWALSDTGLIGAGGLTGKVCGTCAPFWGPPPGTGVGPFCTSIWTPNSITGLNAACAGGGVTSADGTCACVKNGTAITISAPFSILQFTSGSGNAASQVIVTAVAHTCA